MSNLRPTPMPPMPPTIRANRAALGPVQDPDSHAGPRVRPEGGAVDVGKAV
jgi:hypothetical protein